jgi:hypothetical protein
MLNLQIEGQQVLEAAALPAVVGPVLFAISGQLMARRLSPAFHLLPSSQSLLRAQRLLSRPSAGLLETQHIWQCRKEWKLRCYMRLGSGSALTFALGTSKHSPEHCLRSFFGRAVSHTTAFPIVQASFLGCLALLVETASEFDFFAQQQNSLKPASHIPEDSWPPGLSRYGAPRYIASSRGTRGV